MGISKRSAEKMDDKYQEALIIALEAGALEECEHHGSCYFEGSEPPVEAYKLAAYKLKAGTLSYTYKNQKELTDILHYVIVDNSGTDECQTCAAHDDE